MTHFLGDVQIRLDEPRTWINTPLMEGVLKRVRASFTDFSIEKSSDSEEWTVTSLKDLAARVCYMTTNATVVLPLIALASIVEGVIRTFFGAGLYLLGLIPFEGNKTVSTLGWKLLKSTHPTGKVIFEGTLGIFMIPAFVLWFSGQYLNDTSFGTKKGGEEQELKGLFAEDDVAESPFLESAALSSISRRHWTNNPYMDSVFIAHAKSISDFEIIKNDYGWNVTSPVDLALRVTILSLNTVTVQPLIFIANLVEGVMRAVFGSIACLMALIPFEGNKMFSDLGWRVLESSVKNGRLALVNGALTFYIPATCLKNAGHYLWDSAFCTKTEAVQAALATESCDGGGAWWSSDSDTQSDLGAGGRREQ